MLDKPHMDGSKPTKEWNERSSSTSLEAFHFGSCARFVMENKKNNGSCDRLCQIKGFIIILLFLAFVH